MEIRILIPFVLLGNFSFLIWLQDISFVFVEDSTGIVPRIGRYAQLDVIFLDVYNSLLELSVLHIESTRFPTAPFSVSMTLDGTSEVKVFIHFFCFSVKRVIIFLSAFFLVVDRSLSFPILEIEELLEK